MVRKGIYVNGKEIVARYVGDKLVWKKKVLTEIADISVRYVINNHYSLSVLIYGNFARLRQETFSNVMLVVDGVSFAHEAKEVTLRPQDPIAIIQFDDWTAYQKFIQVVREYRNQSIRMFIKE